jgi:hypothetical protein
MTIGSILLVAFLAAATAHARDELLMPTDALHRAQVALRLGDRKQQKALVEPHLLVARKAGLEPTEEMALGELYFMALDPVRSDAIFRKHLARTDRLGRMAWLRHQQVQFRAFENYAQCERDLSAFRRQFPVTVEDLTYSSGAALNLARRAAEAGDHARAAQLVLDDVAGLPRDVPFRAFRALGTLAESLVHAGRGPEARAILEDHRARLQARIAKAVPGLRPASSLSRDTPEHRAGHLHVDWDTGLADDEPGFDADRFATQVALDRIAEIDAALGRLPAGQR